MLCIVAHLSTASIKPRSLTALAVENNDEALEQICSDHHREAATVERQACRHEAGRTEVRRYSSSPFPRPLDPAIV